MGKIVALVPSRAGSTRVKDKNIRQIYGMPLIGIAVRQALDVPEIDDIYISTDSELYADIAVNYGAVCPFLRPKEISGDTSTDYEVFSHFLEWYESVYKELPEMIVQVRATAPIRYSESISKAIGFMRDHPEFDSLRSVSKPHQTPYKMWYLDENKKITPVMSDRLYDMPTQKAPACFGQDGIVDIVRPSTLLKYKNMAGEKIAGFLDHPQTWDIDIEADLEKASKMMDESGIYRLPKRKAALGGNLGIIQGRLTESKELQCFPTNWKAEFEKVRKCGYTSIELFRDKDFNEENPIWAENCDIEDMTKTSFKEGIGIRSICDDYIQKCDWNNLSLEQVLLIEDIIIKAHELKAMVVVFPMFEKADIYKNDSTQSFLKYINKLGKLAEKLNVKIALEISEKPEKLVDLFSSITSKNVGLCVDTGNLYAAGIDAKDIMTEEKLKERIMHVHLKDRDESGKNVVPGRGKVNFEPIMKALYEMQYTGLLITETDRGNDPLSTAIDNKKFFLKE